MIVKTEAIVLHFIKYGDNKIIVDMFTNDSGRLSFIVMLSQSKRSKAKKQFFQPLTLLSIEYDFRPNKDMQTLRDVALAVPMVSIPFDVYKLSISLFSAEFLYYALRREQKNEILFAYIMDSIQWLDRAEKNFSNFHIVFLMRLTRFLGFFPNLDDYTDGCFFDMRSSCFCISQPIHRDFLKPSDAEIIKLMMRMNYSTMYLYKMSRTQRNRLLEVIVHYYRLHIPDFPELKSMDVLRELFD